LKFNVKAIADRVFKFFFDGIITANIEHVVDKKEKAKPLVVFVVVDK
jgi:hypothetical protein